MHLKLAAFLFKYFYFLYQPLYFLFKKQQDAPEIRLYKKYIKNGYTLIDIGANIGFTAKLFSELVGTNGKVYAFEPDALNFKRLTQFIHKKKLSNVIAIQKAVSNSCEPIKLYLSNRLNVDHRAYKVDEYDKVIEIEATTIDEFVYKNKIDEVNFIKMDIQGYEMTAIQGMQITLDKNPDIVILSEFWPEGLKQAGSSIDEYYNFLINKGFKVYLINKTSIEILSPEKLALLNQYKGDNFENIIFSKKDLI